MGMLHRQDGQRMARDRQCRPIHIAVWAILVAGLILRLSLYGDPRLAVATLDTKSYIESSRASLLSWDALSGRRLFTTNLVYKLISSNSNCGQMPVSMPAVGKEARRAIVPCFETLAVLQTFLSIASWLWLVFVVSRRLKAPLTKLLAAGVLVCFAFTPHIADWDSILTSEALSLSLFAASLGFLIEIAFSLADERSRTGGYIKSLYVLWFVFFALWVFVRDTNLIAIPVALMFLVPIFFSRSIRARPPILALAILLIALFALGSLAARQSSRWPPSIQETLEDWVFPFPARTRFLTEHFAMPAPDSAAYKSWFENRAPSAYVMFVLSNPGFVVSTVMDNWYVLHLSYEQPYYEAERTNARLVMSRIGETVHPGSPVFYLVDTIVLVSFLAAARSGRARDHLAWVAILTWLYLTAAITLCLSFIGDAEGLMRHILPSLEMFRLFLWFSLIVLADVYISHSDPPVTQPGSLAANDAEG